MTGEGNHTLGRLNLIYPQDKRAKRKERSHSLKCRKGQSTRGHRAFRWGGEKEEEKIRHLVIKREGPLCFHVRGKKGGKENLGKLLLGRPGQKGDGGFLLPSQDKGKKKGAAPAGTTGTIWEGEKRGGEFLFCQGIRRKGDFRTKSAESKQPSKEEKRKEERKPTKAQKGREYFRQGEEEILG